MAIVPPLAPGATVAICAPAGPVPEDRLRAGVEVLARRYDVRIGDGVLARNGYLAGDDARRADELRAALADPDVRAIFIARGGYGSTRILDQLDPAALTADPITIVGFSDATALLAWAWAAGVAGVHGPVVTQLGELPVTDQQALFRALEEPDAAVELGALAAIGAPGEVAGPIIGGNLSLLAHLVGTPYQPDVAGQVVLIEDIGERPYAVDRYLTHLAMAGALRGAAGVLIGDFTDCDETKGPPEPDVWAVIDERLRSFGLSGRRGAPIGHGRRNVAVRWGGALGS